jgi:hypothetical protein
VCVPRETVMVAGSAANITRFARLAAGVAIVLPGIAGIVAGMPLSLELQQRPVVAWIVAGTAAAVAVVGERVIAAGVAVGSARTHRD